MRQLLPKWSEWRRLRVRMHLARVIELSDKTQISRAFENITNILKHYSNTILQAGIQSLFKSYKSIIRLMQEKTSKKDLD
jgi:hypothetical protein